MEKGTISFPTLLPRWVIESSAIIIQAKARVCAGVGERFERERENKTAREREREKKNSKRERVMFFFVFDCVQNIFRFLFLSFAPEPFE